MFKFKLGHSSRSKHKKGCVGINIFENGISMAYALVNDTNIPEIVATQYKICNSDSEKKICLNEWLKAEALEGQECCLALNDSEYSLNLIDLPIVPPNEIKGALMWLVKDMIDYPIIDAVLDLIVLPFERSRDNKKIAYAVASPKKIINKHTNFLVDVQLKLLAIDIYELIIGNVLDKYIDGHKTVVYAELSERGLKLLFFQNKNLILVRQSDIKINENESEEKLEQLALEIQRSFDYFASMFKQSIPQSIILMPMQYKIDKIKNQLFNSIGINMTMLDLNECIKLTKPIDSNIQPKYLSAIGASLSGLLRHAI